MKASESQIIFKETNTSSMNDSEIKKEISSFFMNNSFYPVLTNSEIKYEITGVFEDSGIVYTLGALSQDTNCLYTLFSFQKGWFWTTTELLYMSTDVPPTPLLFRDICYSIQVVLPRRLSNYHVLIQKLENPSKEGNMQLWVFYNKDEYIKFIVKIVATPDGGSDFIIGLCDQ